MGDNSDCQNTKSNYAVIHACKTCHQKTLGYQSRLHQTDPNYLIYEIEDNLYLNIVDMPTEQKAIYIHPIMKKSIKFINKHIDTKNILIHCNHGKSRSPSIALVYLAHKNIIFNNAFDEAKNNFIDIFPNYLPNTGIELYLQKNW
ncbi:MAG: dual specificity protein phosphatase family protein [Nitrospirae bacterium]|nr:dual specificity protein phosphatase family protein [Nitrospirota bacterium]